MSHHVRETPWNVILEDRRDGYLARIRINGEEKRFDPISDESIDLRGQRMFCFKDNTLIIKIHRQTNMQTDIMVY
ncbi:hypothetical protein WUBG_18881 [Wuchereria bancrofti]|uniref:Uncharacterized protein n=1 Tax=Wuchereria bancrofti TaxID=6293 RepID=J9DL66_WUCBA|nr:hypothetical protein WUBG_18881 [Wuchereria bancrofti]